MLYNNFYVPHENLNRRALVHHDFWIEFAFLKKSGAIFFEIHYVFLKYIYLILSCSSPPACKRGALISVKMDGWVAPATMKLMALSWRCIVTAAKKWPEDRWYSIFEVKLIMSPLISNKSCWLWIKNVYFLRLSWNVLFTKVYCSVCHQLRICGDVVVTWKIRFFQLRLWKHKVTRILPIRPC